MKLELIDLFFPSFNIELCLKGFITSISKHGITFNEDWVAFYGSQNSFYVAIWRKAVKITLLNL